MTRDPSLQFRAGFVCGLRSAWGLEAWHHLVLMRSENRRDYEAGYAAGWAAAEHHSAIIRANELLPVVYGAWQEYAQL